ncbi:MAG: hypothetical protein ACTSSE_16070 [Candidatus Thorarchaeota archaeon]
MNSDDKKSLLAMCKTCAIMTSTGNTLRLQIEDIITYHLGYDNFEDFAKKVQYGEDSSDWLIDKLSEGNFTMKDLNMVISEFKMKINRSKD